MSDEYNYRNVGYGSDSTSAPKHDKLNRPMPSREELLSRNSFGSVNDNKHLNRMMEKAK